MEKSSVVAGPKSALQRFARTPMAAAAALYTVVLPVHAQVDLSPTGSDDTVQQMDAAPAAGVVPVSPQVTDESDAARSGAPSPRGGNRFVEEIVVTAQKREEALMDVPISIQAFSADQLDARGLVNVRDLSLATPGMTFTDIAGYTLIYLRGVGTDAFVPSADPSIATYLDGIYFPSQHSLAQSFGALERIEILKGPQGTLFGRNSTGGAISVVTKKPGSTPETSVQVSYGNFNDIKSRVYTNIPIGDEAAISVSGIYNRSDSYYKLDNFAGESLLPDTSKGARLRARWFPSEDLDITLTGMMIEGNGPGSVISATTHPSPLASLLGVRAETRDYTVSNDINPAIKTNTNTYYGEADWGGLQYVDVKVLGSYYNVKAHDFQYDFDASSQPLISFHANPEYQTIKTAELQFLSNDETWGSDWLKWVGGLYYLKSEGGYDPAYLSVANSAVRLPTGELIDLAQPILDRAIALLPILGQVPAPETVGLYFRGLLGTESYSGFLQGTASVADWLDVTAGARYQTEKRELLVSNVEIANLNQETTTLIRFAPRGKTVHNLSPKVSFDFHVIDDTLLYLSWTKGFKSATYNIVNIYTQPDYVKPEEVTAYEAGVKSKVLGGAVQFTAAVFQTNITNLQTSSVSLLSGGAVNFENAGKARIRGVEFDTTVLPFPDANPGLVIAGGASYLDAIYTDYKDGNGFDETTGLNFESRDFSGNRIARTPKFSANGSISQTFELTNGSLEVAGDIYFNDGFYFLAQNSPVSYEPAYKVVNARVSYLYQPWNTRVTVFGANLTDELYNIQQFHTDFGRADTHAPPRTYGVRLNWDF